MKKELLEIKRTLTIDRYNITRITGYIVDNDRNCRLEFVKNFLNLEETETFKYLDIFKKVLSGKPGRNMFQLDFEGKTRKACCNKLAEYEDLEETGMISKWIPVKWHVILDAEREEEGIPDDIVYYLDCPMPEDGEEIIVTDGKRVWTDENSIDIVGHYLESGNDWKDIKAWMPLPKPYKKGGNND